MHNIFANGSFWENLSLRKYFQQNRLCYIQKQKLSNITLNSSHNFSLVRLAVNAKKCFRNPHYDMDVQIFEVRHAAFVRRCIKTYIYESEYVVVYRGRGGEEKMVFNKLLNFWNWQVTLCSWCSSATLSIPFFFPLLLYSCKMTLPILDCRLSIKYWAEKQNLMVKDELVKFPSCAKGNVCGTAFF